MKELASDLLRPRKKSRYSGRRETTNILIRVGGFLLAFLFVLIFIGFAIKNDAKDIVIELMKYVVPLIIGGLGGFYIGKAKGKDEASGE